MHSIADYLTLHTLYAVLIIIGTLLVVWLFERFGRSSITINEKTIVMSRTDASAVIQSMYADTHQAYLAALQDGDAQRAQAIFERAAARYHAQRDR